ncbi:hypothetical protein DPMN_151924 [Dreissena polymorpha]|uniref:Uncharacterized protein n=1 Tax=Dreissena polymorpha TaxID=45954 RepID=A0A9D4FKF2_DREPO|nr:hypothetical protein DPMN_151924 [Dreissena polymorpha]
MALQRPTRLVMGQCIVEINRIVIREVQYQLEVNRCRNEEVIVKGVFGLVWPMWTGRPRVGNGAMHKVQYQLEVNQCSNEEIIVKGNFGWVWPMWAGCPRFDRIVIREVQYQFEVNQLKGNFGWVWSMWAGRPRIDRIVIREVQYQFEVNRCRNEEVNFQCSSANSDGRTDHNIPTLFKKPPARGDCNMTYFKLNQGIIRTNLLTKIHEDRTRTVASRTTAPPTGGQVFQWSGTTFKLNQNIMKTNILTNFELDRCIIGTNLLTKFHEDRKKMWPLE